MVVRACTLNTCKYYAPLFKKLISINPYHQLLGTMSVTPSTKIFSIVAQVSDHFRTNPQEAQIRLAKVEKTVPEIDAVWNETTKLQGETVQRELENEVETTKGHLDSLQKELNKLCSSVSELYEIKAEFEKKLSFAKIDKQKEEHKKREAEKDKDVAVLGTLAVSAGAAVIGVLFPPSLFLTVPAVAAGTALISDASSKIDSCKKNIADLEHAIAQKEEEIQTANNDIINIQITIGDLETKQLQLDDKLKKMKNSHIFMQRAVNYFKELRGILQEERDPSSMLHSFVGKTTRPEQYVLISEGIEILAGSFAEAWENLEDKIMSSDCESFKKITFVEVPVL